MKNEACGVYKISCSNGFTYFGRSKNMHKRIGSHLSLLKRGKHYNKILQNHFSKLGKSEFIFSIVKSTKTYKEACLLERKMLKNYSLKKSYNNSKKASISNIDIEILKEAHIMLPKDLIDFYKQDADKKNRSFTGHIRHLLQIWKDAPVS